MMHKTVFKAFLPRLGLCLLLAILPPAVLHSAPPRMALVIGSEAVTGRGCEETARDVGDTLHQLGFTVHLLLHPSLIALRSALGNLAADLGSATSGSPLIYACARAIGDGTRLFVLPSDPDPRGPIQPQTQAVVLQALLNALASSDGTLYADLALPQGMSPNGFVEHVPDRLHLALAVFSGENPAAIGKHLMDPNTRLDQCWRQIAGVLKSVPDAESLMLLPVPTPGPADAPSQVASGAAAPNTAAPAATPSPELAPQSAAIPAPQMPANAATPTDRAAVPTPAPTATSANHARAWKQATGNGAQRSSARTARIQAALAHHHAYDGPIDGLIGPGTLMAIRTFQRSLGDTATGVLTRSEIIQLVTF